MGQELKDAYSEEIRLTQEQSACVDYSGSRTLLVKGLAGSGKSVVLEALAKKLLARGADEHRQTVAVFTFSNALCSATRELLDENGAVGDQLTVSTLLSFISKAYSSSGAPYAKVREEPWLRKKCVTEALEQHRTQCGPHRFQNLEPEFWLSEFDWMKEMNVTSGDRDYYLSLPRRGRGSRVRMTSADREEAFRLYIFYTEAQKLRRQYDWSDHCLWLVRHPENVPESCRFDHVLIDEAQDFSLLQMKTAMLFARRDMVVAMDMNQRIYDKQWTPKLLGIETTTKKLTKSMRTTKQIDELAESVRKHNDPELEDDDRTLRAVPEREGALPIVEHLASKAEEQRFVIDQLRTWLARPEAASIGLISATNKQAELYAHWLGDAGIPHERISRDSSFHLRSPGVKLVNVYNAKGLEFSRVLIPQFTDDHFPGTHREEDEEKRQLFLTKARNLVYVAMTRARHTLMLTYAGANGSRFLGEMDPALMEQRGQPPAVAIPEEDADDAHEVQLPPTAKGTPVTMSSSADSESYGRPAAAAAKPAARSRGFLSWDGQKTDHYGEVIDYAKEEAQKEERAARERRSRAVLADSLHVPELAAVSETELLRFLIREQKKADLRFKDLYHQSGTTETETLVRVRKDFWLQTILGVLADGKLDQAHRCRFTDSFLNDIFRIGHPLHAIRHEAEVRAVPSYKTYIHTCFSPEPESPCLFWQWAGVLGRKAGCAEEAKKLAALVLHFELHLAYYMNLLAPKQEIGRRLAERGRLRQGTILSALRRGETEEELRTQLVNPTSVSSAFQSPEETASASEVPAQNASKSEKKSTQEPEIVIQYEQKKEPLIDKEVFEQRLKEETLAAQLMALNQLIRCRHTDPELRDLLERIGDRTLTLKDAAEQHRAVYDVDVTSFTEYYIPETFRLILTYLEYAELEAGPSVLSRMRADTMQAADSLLNGINGKIEELFRFVSIYARAQARAVDAMLARDGYTGGGCNQNTD